MNNELKFQLRKAKISLFSFRYSPYFGVFMPIVSFVVCLLLIFFFIIPQLQSWFSVQSEIDATTLRIQNIKANALQMEQSNTQTIEKTFGISTQALPATDNFTNILAAIANAAQESQIALEDFNFSLGEVVQKEEVAEGTGEVVDQPIPNAAPVGDYKLVNIQLESKGTGNRIQNFIHAIEKELPLIEVKTVKVADNRTIIDLNVYTRALPLITVNDTEILSPLSEEEKKLLTELETWPGVN